MTLNNGVNNFYVKNLPARVGKMKYKIVLLSLIIYIYILNNSPLSGHIFATFHSNHYLSDIWAITNNIFPFCEYKVEILHKLETTNGITYSRLAPAIGTLFRSMVSSSARIHLKVEGWRNWTRFCWMEII